jgi:hypothetical protein
VEGGSETVWGGWAATVLQIQCFHFGSRGETMGWSVAGRWNKDNAFILALWEGSVTQRSGVTMLVRWEVASGRENRVDNDNWTDMNLIGSKNNKKSRGWFIWYKWMMKI